MDRHKPPRNVYLLLSGISGFILLAGFINVFPPDGILRIVLFIAALCVSTGLILQYLFRSAKQSILLSFGAAVFLGLRLFGLRSPIYLVLLIASIVSLELTLRKR